MSWPGQRDCGVPYQLEDVWLARGLREADLARAYKSQVDPRLNYEQAIEIAMLIARRLRAQD